MIKYDQTWIDWECELSFLTDATDGYNNAVPVIPSYSIAIYSSSKNTKNICINSPYICAPKKRNKNKQTNNSQANFGCFHTRPSLADGSQPRLTNFSPNLPATNSKTAGTTRSGRMQRKIIKSYERIGLIGLGEVWDISSMAFFNVTCLEGVLRDSPTKPPTKNRLTTIKGPKFSDLLISMGVKTYKDTNQ